MTQIDRTMIMSNRDRSDRSTAAHRTQSNAAVIMSTAANTVIPVTMRTRSGDRSEKIHNIVG